eukprot:403340304
MQREVVKVDLETLPQMARRLFEEGKTREQARQQIREIFHDPNDENKRTIVAKIKKYIMKFWRDGPIQVKENQVQQGIQQVPQEQEKQENLEQIQALQNQEINHENSIQLDFVTQNPQETARNLLQDLKSLSQKNQDAQNLIENKVEEKKDEYNKVRDVSSIDIQHNPLFEKRKIQEVNAEPLSIHQNQPDFFSRLQQQSIHQNSLQESINNEIMQNNNPARFQERQSKKRLILDRLSSVIEEQDILEQRLKRLKTEQKLLSEQLANCQD